uniref:AAA_11 domain-containing protein n=1 Tax=Panagrellus redivivus TaxID=6233 RepID=A0A7E4WC01_PANRE
MAAYPPNQQKAANRGFFIPPAIVSQPRRWSDVHLHNVDLEDLKKPITDFASAVKMYDSIIRLELEFNENKAVYTANSCAFSVKEVTADKFIINIDQDNDLFSSEFKLNVDDHVYLEMPKRNGLQNGPDRFKYAVGYITGITKYHVEVVTYDRYKSFNIDEDQEQIVTESHLETTDDALEIEFDTDQMRAWKQITSESKTTFVLTGPPGTGKTTVMIEAIWNLVEQGKRVLVTTSSNIAADAFTNRFLERFDDHNQVFRLTKATRDFSKTSDKVKALSGFQKVGDEWEYLPPDSVDRYSVVITTLGMSYKLRTM